MSPKQAQRLERMREEKELAKAMAFDVAARYCKENGLSVEKLRTQQFDLFADIACFSQPSGVKPEGLTNDLKTQPYPTLILKAQNGKLVVEQTEHTHKFLAQ